MKDVAEALKNYYQKDEQWVFPFNNLEDITQTINSSKDNPDNYITEENVEEVLWIILKIYGYD